METTKKYELTDEVINADDIKLRRIRAVRDFGDVKAGDLGGFVQSETNLSHHDDAWVCGNARVFGDARVYDNAEVCGNAWVCDDAKVYGNAWVCDDAKVCGNAWVCDDAKVCGNARVCGDAEVCGNAEVCGDAWVYDNAWVYGNARVCGNAKVCGNAWVCGNAEVCGNAWVCGCAGIQSSDDLCTFGYFGSKNRQTTAFRTKDGGIAVHCGCFCGTLEQFRERVKKTHGTGDYATEYLMIADLIEHKLSKRGKA